MKARLPKGYAKGSSNLQKLAKQAKQMQEDMEKATKELEEKEYTSTVGGGAVEVCVSGKLEVKSIEIKPEVVDKDDIEMLSDLILAATNEALRQANEDKENTMNNISGDLNLPGMF